MKKIIALVIIISVLLGVFAFWRNTTFHIISTTPSAQNVSTISPYLQINFSQLLSGTNLKVVSSSNFIDRPRINGKTLTVPFILPLISGKNYSVTIVSVNSVKGKAIYNQVFSFKPMYIPSSQLPEEQQQTLLKRESIPGPAVVNINALGNYGFDQNQIANVKQELLTFKPSLKLATINLSSITIGSYNSNDPNAHAPILFEIVIDGVTYQANVLGNNDSDDIILTLTNLQTNVQIFQGNSATN